MLLVLKIELSKGAAIMTSSLPTTVLHLDASIHSERGQSSQLAARFVQSYQQRHPTVHVIHRDLAIEPVPHLTAERFAAFGTGAEQRDAAQRGVVAYSDALIAELRQADVIVLGLPMYNFGVPSQLKAYFDHIARAGETFRYTAQGPVGLLQGKSAYIFATRGGLYVGTPLDTQTGYVRDFLRFIGIERTQFIYAEGLALSDERRETQLAQVVRQIETLAA
jgi:FMN-dependent NADH-azoreductase